VSASGALVSASWPVYDEIGLGYARRRRADPRLAKPIFAALKRSSTVLDVGAGAGSYEPRDRRVDSAALQRGLDQLAEDLRTGTWVDRYGDLLEREELDCGLPLVVGESP
jgi:hypothetical protein